jgi:predicted benzoate:H+ symporter BenE
VPLEETDLATWDVVSVASDIAGAGTALAGLLLVYLGAVAVRYETLDYKAQTSARDGYRRHARRAFHGIVFALGAAIAALIAKSLKSEPYAAIIATLAGLALLASFFIAVMAAYWTRKSLD